MTFGERVVLHRVCEDRIGTGPPRAETEVIYVNLGYWAISGSVFRVWGDLGGEAGVVIEAHKVLVVLLVVPRHPPLGGKAGFLS